ncbi:hypothetical protein N7G274_010737 [Stereocaulon virgatum]|uniref:Uncharacterized protein n=1 Tax=Stereocaulon virgatum TaxID=373712 RepID=A0ABR3ZT14_9LECA
MIHTAIKDYETGAKKVQYFQAGGLSKAYEDIRRAWQELKPIYQALIPEFLMKKITTQVGADSEEEEECSREIIRDSSDDDSDDHQFNKAIIIAPRTSALLRRIYSDSPRVPSSSHCGKDAAPEIDHEDNVLGLLSVGSVNKDSTRVMNKTLGSNMRTESPRRPTMSPLTPVGMESNSVSEDAALRMYDDGLIKTLGAKEFILRFEEAESKETSKLTYSRFKNKYKVEQGERTWYDNNMFNDSKGYSRFLEQAVLKRIITVERGTDDDFQSPSR